MTQYVRVIILLVKEIQSKPAFPVLLRNVPVGRSRLSPAKLADFTQGFTKNPHHLTFPFTLQQYTRSHAPALGGVYFIYGAKEILCNYIHFLFGVPTGGP